MYGFEKGEDNKKREKKSGDIRGGSEAGGWVKRVKGGRGVLTGNKNGIEIEQREGKGREKGENEKI